jgi:hypothetical protein
MPTLSGNYLENLSERQNGEQADEPKSRSASFGVVMPFLRDSVIRDVHADTIRVKYSSWFKLIAAPASTLSAFRSDIGPIRVTTSPDDALTIST